MTKSNLCLRSNVYLRDPNSRLVHDMTFVHKIRGVGAVHKLLDWYAVPRGNRRPGDPEIERLVRMGKLTKAQQTALAWELRCVRCDSIPCGVNFHGAFEFRCERRDCRKK